jgi:hypothetical protein
MKDGGAMKTIRAHLTFTFDETKATREQIVDRLDAAIETAFPDMDVHTRWIATLADSPLFGAAKRAREKGGA